MPFLDEIVESTRERLEATRRSISQEEIDAQVEAAPPPRDLAHALASSPHDPALIAEIKRATPSGGDLAGDVDVAGRARAYAAGGAAAISVLTEPRWFKGAIGDLRAARSADVPLLRKDFILDPFQVQESRAAGADAVLLIVRILSAGALRGLVLLCHQMNMTPLVEVYADLEQALHVGATVIGVNHRNLDTFEVDPDRTAKLASLVPPEVTLISLSGVASRADVESAGSAGARAVLVGTTLMRAPEPEAAVREFLGA
jgi:indole-3-glycerol phosphate synthase